VSTHTRRGDLGHRRQECSLIYLKGKNRIMIETLSTTRSNGTEIVFWHRELPPLEACALAEHVVEATSSRVPGTLLHRDELWTQCYKDLMTKTAKRLKQEVLRLGGRYAHVLDESIESRYDGGTSESWLDGRFTYMLYR
jgi:hypothetical protein